MDNDFLDLASGGEFDREIGPKWNEKLSQRTLFSIPALCPTESHARAPISWVGSVCVFPRPRVCLIYCVRPPRGPPFRRITLAARKADVLLRTFRLVFLWKGSVHPVCSRQLLVGVVGDFPPVPRFCREVNRVNSHRVKIVRFWKTFADECFLSWSNMWLIFTLRERLRKLGSFCVTVHVLPLNGGDLEGAALQVSVPFSASPLRCRGWHLFSSLRVMVKRAWVQLCQNTNQSACAAVYNLKGTYF